MGLMLSVQDARGKLPLSRDVGEHIKWGWREEWLEICGKYIEQR